MTCVPVSKLTRTEIMNRMGRNLRENILCRNRSTWELILYIDTVVLDYKLLRGLFGNKKRKRTTEPEDLFYILKERKRYFKWPRENVLS